MGLRLAPAELESAKDIERNCFKHIAVVNDIYSWEKELLASRTGHEEGSALCSAVQVMAVGANVPTDASKRILWTMCREWELCHEQLVAKRKTAGGGLKCSKEVMRYIKGLEYQMSGNELWSQSTLRYIGVKVE